MDSNSINRIVTNPTVYNRSIYKYNLIDVYKYNHMFARPPCYICASPMQEDEENPDVRDGGD
jgi:hypothetical protein